MKMRLSMSLDMGTSEMVSKAYKAVGAQSDYILGNLHLNIVAAAYTPEIEAALEPFVYELVGKSVLAMVHNVICSFSSASYKGSISAEHGIGVMKTHALQYSKNSTSIEWMKRIKALFDPNGIMNPGKVLP